MIYIWLDESDKKGPYYSNFYGGILIESHYYESFSKKLDAVLKENGIGEEIKWTDVNRLKFDGYSKVVDFLFEELKSGYVKIRIFFRNNKNQPSGLTKQHKENTFTILYYEFIKHAFGLQYCDWPVEERFVRLYLDDIPARGSQVAVFKQFILRLNYEKGFQRNGMTIRSNEIIEVDSKLHRPLQLLDLILGAMCFRLNKKHLIKDVNTNRRGVRTIMKERLYKHILSKICELRPNFNIGKSTGITNLKDRWEHPYRHWEFIPASRD